VGVNPLQETFLLEREAFQPDCVRTIINGVQLPGTQCSPARDREGPLRILFVGRLNQLHKRVLDMAPLVEELHSRGVSFQLTVAGSGEDEAELQRRLQTHADAGRVLFAGYVQPNHLHTGLYPTHDTLITLSPELGEACPLVIQEAMAHGVVPICTNFIGVHSLGFLINGRTGYIYPCGDSMRAADHLTALASDPALLDTMSENCREASRGFALEIAHKRWLDSFEELVERPPCPPPANLGEIDLEPAPGGGRLDRLLSPAGADRARRAFRRWPNLPDGWAEWPGSIGHVDEETRIRMLAELRELDEIAAYSLEAAASLA
jgi:glycosyltransferase involved in cell wall biosynthesis